MKFACPVEASSFVADPRILIIFFLFCFFFLPAVSHGTEKVLRGGVLTRHPSNKWYQRVDLYPDPPWIGRSTAGSIDCMGASHMFFAVHGTIPWTEMRSKDVG